MNNARPPLHVLFSHRSRNDVEPIVNLLRNAGQAVRNQFVADLDELKLAIDEQDWDMLIIRLNESSIENAAALEAIRQSQKDIPVIGLCETYDHNVVAEALLLGMSDVIVESAEQHMVLAVQREFLALQQRRALSRTQQSLIDTQERCELLLRNSVDAIAYIHEGMHIYANTTYMQLFGYADLDELQSTPLMDLVSGDQVNSLKKILKTIKSTPVTEFDTVAQRADDTEFAIHLIFSMASYEGEACTQVIARQRAKSNEPHSAPASTYEPAEDISSEQSNVAAEKKPTKPPASGATLDKLAEVVESAIKNNGLQLQFQPIMSLRGDNREHYEILVRLKNKDAAPATDLHFLQHFDEAELGGEVDRWVVTTALTQLAAAKKPDNNTQLMMHLTSFSIKDPTFLPWVNTLLKAKKMAGDVICFQISEATAAENLKAAKAFGKGLRLLKCQLCINRFGITAEGANLSRHLDINYARVDDSYVAEMLTSEQTPKGLTELLQAIHKNDINSIVAKVEEPKVLSTLWELGVNYIQGVYLQAPLDGMDYDFDATEEEEP